MDQKSRTRIAVLVSLIIVAAVFASFGYTLLSVRTPPVVLPTVAPDGSTAPPGVPDDGQMLRVEVTRETVQAVIASLDREGSYYRQLTAETFWEGGSGSVSVQAWADGGYTLVRCALSSGQVRCTLETEDALYYWYDGDDSWRTAPAGSLSADLAQRIPTYEDVLELPLEAISGAGYGEREEQLCIYVETVVDALGYVERYWVSVESGLLIAAETLKGEETVYSMTAYVPLQTPCPAGTIFALPDGTVLHSA